MVVEEANEEDVLIEFVAAMEVAVEEAVEETV